MPKSPVAEKRKGDVARRSGGTSWREKDWKGSWDGWLAPVSKVTLYDCITAEWESGDVEEERAGGGGLREGGSDRSSHETESKKTEAPFSGSDLHIQD